MSGIAVELEGQRGAMSQTEFDEFVKRQRSQTADEVEVDWNARRVEWLTDLDDLYVQVESFLKKYVSSGDIVLRYEPIAMNEEKLGAYEAKRLILRIGTQEVVLMPVGAQVIGAKGRVDLVGSRGGTRIVLVPKDVSRPRITISTGHRETRKDKKSGQHQAEWSWKISTPPPSITLIELTAESLMQAIMEVANA